MARLLMGNMQSNEQTKMVQLTLEQLTDKIQTSLIGAKHLGIEWLTNTLNELTGYDFTNYDSCIDDGADDDETEDEYVMRDSFSDDVRCIYVRVYYGDVTREIGYVDVAQI